MTTREEFMADHQRACGDCGRRDTECVCYLDTATPEPEVGPCPGIGDHIYVVGISTCVACGKPWGQTPALHNFEPRAGEE